MADDPDGVRRLYTDACAGIIEYTADELETDLSVRGHRHHPGRPRRRPEKLHSDKGYDYPTLPQISAPARDQSPHRPPRHRGRDQARAPPLGWVVERTLSWLLRFKRLGLRYDRTQLTLRSLFTWAAY